MSSASCSMTCARRLNSPREMWILKRFVELRRLNAIRPSSIDEVASITASIPSCARASYRVRGNGRSLHDPHSVFGVVVALRDRRKRHDEAGLS